jgi:hypothetical protein
MRRWKAANPGKTLKEQRQRLALGLIDHLPWMDLIESDADTAPVTVGFGPNLPEDAAKGDIYMRTDVLPNVLYKFNGAKWIEVNKTLSDNLAYDDRYIDHLISEIDSGRYDPEYLSPAEADAIAARLADK